jgi:hypothetical protein
LRVVERINDCNEENRIDLKGDYHRWGCVEISAILFVF